jgi:hypothetical protein
MADSLQESLKIASRKFEQWKKRMQEAGYTVVGENAFKREKDATSPSGYRDVPVSNYDKDIRKNTYGKLPASAGPDITVPRTGNYESIQPRTWTEKLTIPKTNYVKTPSPLWKGETNEKGGLPIEETVTIDKKNTAATGTSAKWTGKEGSRTLTKPTSIQKKLQKAGFKDEQLIKLMIKYRDKYKSKRGW